MKQAALGRLLRGTLRNGQVRVLMCDTTNMAELCRMTHEPSNVCAAALGRGISAAALLTASADDPDSTNLTMTIKGGGPAGALVVVAHGRRLKAYIDHPQVELPLKANGKLDVGGAVGSTGHITVVRDLGLRDPYVGQTRMVSGEIAEDLAFYLTVSEQTPSLVALGVMVQGGHIQGAGGVLVQPMPDCPEDVMEKLEALAPKLTAVSTMAHDCKTARELAEKALDGVSYEILGSSQPRYECDCSRERIERALLSMGEAELNDMIAQQHGAQVGCQFCNRKYDFTEDELRALIREGKGE